MPTRRRTTRLPPASPLSGRGACGPPPVNRCENEDCRLPKPRPRRREEQSTNEVRPVSPAALPIPDQLVALAREMRLAVEARAKEPHPKILYPLLNLAWHLFGRLGRHLGFILDRFRAGTLAQPKPRRAGETRRTAVAPANPREREPSRPGWLLPVMGHRGVLCATSLRALLENPDLAAFLATAPQTGRQIRPMCRALAVPLPEFLKLPKQEKERPLSPPRAWAAKRTKVRVRGHAAKNSQPAIPEHRLSPGLTRGPRTRSGAGEMGRRVRPGESLRSEAATPTQPPTP